ncbi:MAG: response regulator [Rickettsiales bacterium]|nr:response regulator [Rickettsiales bacterium]
MQAKLSIMSAKKKILIVEDNELNLKLFADLLEANNFDVVQSRDGKNIEDLCNQSSPSLIIMDIQLPNISGLDLIQRLKINETLKEIPIIAVTAFAMEEDKQNILSSGCEEYLSKPISISKFLEVINKHSL